jgi:hypothetical protein
MEYRSKKYTQKLSLLDKKRDFHFFRKLIQPLLFFSLLSVVYAVFSYDSNLIWFNVLNDTTSLDFGGALYSFSSSMVGLTYASPSVGVPAGSFYSGVIRNRVIHWLAYRHKGVLGSEHRLCLFTVPLILIPGSLVLWTVDLVFIMVVIVASNPIGIQLSVTYCIDSYKNLGGTVATIIVIRDIMSFAIDYGITPRVTNMRYQNALILAAFAELAQVLTFLAVVKWGECWRKMTIEMFYKYVKEGSTSGLTH